MTSLVCFLCSMIYRNVIELTRKVSQCYILWKTILTILNRYPFYHLYFVIKLIKNKLSWNGLESCQEHTIFTKKKNVFPVVFFLARLFIIFIIHYDVSSKFLLIFVTYNYYDRILSTIYKMLYHINSMNFLSILPEEWNYFKETYKGKLSNDVGTHTTSYTHIPQKPTYGSLFLKYICTILIMLIFVHTSLSI